MSNFIQNRREARKREEATQRKLDIKTREHELESVYKKTDKEYVKLVNLASELEEEIMKDFARGNETDAKMHCNRLQLVKTHGKIFGNLRNKLDAALYQLKMAVSIEETARLISGIEQLVQISTEMVTTLTNFNINSNAVLGEMLAEDTSMSNDESEELFNTMKDRFLRSQETSVGSTQDVHNSSSHKTEN